MLLVINFKADLFAYETLIRWSQQFNSLSIFVFGTKDCQILLVLSPMLDICDNDTVFVLENLL